MNTKRRAKEFFFWRFKSRVCIMFMYHFVRMSRKICSVSHCLITIWIITIAYHVSLPSSLCVYILLYELRTTLYSTQITYEKKNYCIAFYSILYVFTVVEIKIYYAAIIVEHYSRPYNIMKFYQIQYIWKYIINKNSNIPLWCLFDVSLMKRQDVVLLIFIESYKFLECY